MQDIIGISVIDIEFRKPVVYGNFFLKKVDGQRISIELSQCRVCDKTVKSIHPSKLIIDQLLKLEDHVRNIIGEKKYLNPMIVVNTSSTQLRHSIACQLNMHKTENLPAEAFGRVCATLIGIKISGLFTCLLWRAISFEPEPESVACYITYDLDEQDNCFVEVDQLTLIEIKQSLIDECSVASEFNLKQSVTIDRIKSLLKNDQIIPLDLENARLLLDDLR